MARRRYLSSNISIDGPVNRLAMQFGDFAALLFTWLIPLAGDDATIRGEPEEILAQVMPLRRDVTATQFAEALGQIAEAGLMTWDRAARVLRFKPARYYAYQSYIKEERRGDSAPPPAPPAPPVPPVQSVVADEAGEEPELAALCGEFSADQRTIAVFRGDVGAQQRITAHNSADQRNSAQNAASLRLTSSSSVKEDQLLVAESSGEGEREIARPRPPAREGTPPPVPDLADLVATVEAWATARGIPPDALRDDVERFRDTCISEGRVFRDWAAAARKWLSNQDYGPQARQGAVVASEPRRRAPPAGRQQPPRTERNLEAIMRTRGGS